MGKLDGKVAFISGVARGQGRSHAIRLAEEGADVIGIDICDDYPSMDYGLATSEDLEETARAIEALERRAILSIADVRDSAAVAQAVKDGVEELERLDIVCANAGIAILATWDKTTDVIWKDQVDTNLTGVWNAISAAVPHIVEGDRGGSIICTSSIGGLKGTPFFLPYNAAKWGVRGLVRCLANELAKYNIRVNSICPTGVDTGMASGLGGLNSLIEADPKLGPLYVNALDVEILQPRDVSNAVLWLASEESRYTTGTDVRVDAGNTNR